MEPTDLTTIISPECEFYNAAVCVATKGEISVIQTKTRRWFVRY